MRVRDGFGVLYQDAGFVSLFLEIGQPAMAPRPGLVQLPALMSSLASSTPVTVPMDYENHSK